MIHQKYVDAYIDDFESGKIRLNEDRVQLVAWLKNVVLINDHFYFDEVQIENCINFTEKYFFKLEPFQKFLIAFVFLFNSKLDEVVFDDYFWTMARGAGKNGLISALATYFISELHGIEEYNVAITANSEKQSKVSFKEVHKMLNNHNELVENEYFKNGKEVIIGLDTDSTLMFRSNNASTQDGSRDGALFFDEIHEFETWDIIEVQTSGLGKRPYPRTFYIGTNGFVRDSVYDSFIDRSRDVLSSNTLEDSLFPFICTLDSLDEVEDEDMWEKANPMFSEPMSEYGRRLKSEVRKQWRKIKAGTGNKSRWLVKRMNIMGIKQQSNVATIDEIKDTNREYGNLDKLLCVGSVDLSSTKDFTAVGLLFRDDETGEYKWLTHSFVPKNFLDTETIPAPIDDWSEQGLLTIVDGDLISEDIVVDWFLEQNERYFFDTIVIDTYRAPTLRGKLEEVGFKVITIKRSGGVQAMIGTLLETLFAKRLLVFGTPTMMNWYTNNVYVKRDKQGNPQYEKKEPIKRKTDGFMAFIHALYVMNKEMPLEVHTEFILDDLMI